MSIRDELVDIVSMQLDVDASEVTDDASFTEDLNADSLDLAELIMEFEEEFGIEISDEEAEQISTVGEAIEQIKSAQ